MNAVPIVPGSTSCCPKCFGTDISTVDIVLLGFGPGVSLCNACSCMWESFDAALIWDPDDPLVSFAEPCNNCAFRPGSKEQQDTVKWRDLIDQLKGGAGFYCHKGVPIECGHGQAHAYPQREIETSIDGETVKSKVYDTRKLRICRGYLNMIFGKVRRDRGASV
jgi:hypothetical protein